MSYVRPYAQQADLPSATVTRLHSSRKIDFEAGDFAIDAQGNPEGENDTDHLVKMLIMQVAPVKNGVITPRESQRRRQELRASLKPLVDAKDIRLTSIRTEQVKAGHLVDRVGYQNLGTGRTQTVERKHS